MFDSDFFGPLSSFLFLVRLHTLNVTRWMCTAAALDGCIACASYLPSRGCSRWTSESASVSIESNRSGESKQCGWWRPMATISDGCAAQRMQCSCSAMLRHAMMSALGNSLGWLLLRCSCTADRPHPIRSADPSTSLSVAAAARPAAISIRRALLSRAPIAGVSESDLLRIHLAVATDQHVGRVVEQRA